MAIRVTGAFMHYLDSATCFVRRPAPSSVSSEIHDEFSDFIAVLLRSLILSLLN